jgi:hypothetical protein
MKFLTALLRTSEIYLPFEERYKDIAWRVCEVLSKTIFEKEVAA